MGRYNFVSPGASFTDEMTRMLAERKAEQRQQMLDELTQKQEERAQKDAESLWAARDLQSKAAQQNMDLQELAALEAGFDLGDDPSERLSPEQFERFKQWGRVVPGAPAGTPSVSTDTTFAFDEADLPEDALAGGLPEAGEFISGEETPAEAAARYRFVGTPEARAEEARKRQEGEMISRLMENPETAQVGELLATIVASGQQIPAQIWGELLPGTPMMVFDQETGQMTPALGPDGKPVTTRGADPVINRGYRPREPKGGSGNVQVLGKDENGHPIYFIPGYGAYTDTSVRLGGDPNEGPFGIPVGLLNAHRELLAAATMDQPATGWRGAFGGTEPPAPEVVAEFRAVSFQLIESAKIPPRVKEVAKAVFDDPMLRDIPSAGIAAIYVQRGQLEPMQAGQLIRILDIIRPQPAQSLAPDFVSPTPGPRPPGRPRGPVAEGEYIQDILRGATGIGPTRR
jgi:hypothetical protein